MHNIVFDLGGVVLDWNPDVILEGFYSDARARAAMKAHLFQHSDWLGMDRGSLAESDLVARVATRSGRPARELNQLLEATRESLRPKPDTVALIERLHGQGFPLYCLSNMPASTFAYLRRSYAFWPVFRGIVISGEINMMKPEPEIFEYLLQRFHLSAGDTVFIDDMLANIEAAKRLGLHTIWFRDATQCELELKALLDPG